MSGLQITQNQILHITSKDLQIQQLNKWVSEERLPLITEAILGKLYIRSSFSLAHFLPNNFAEEGFMTYTAVHQQQGTSSSIIVYSQCVWCLNIL